MQIILVSFAMPIHWSYLWCQLSFWYYIQCFDLQSNYFSNSLLNLMDSCHPSNGLSSIKMKFIATSSYILFYFVYVAVLFLVLFLFLIRPVLESKWIAFLRVLNSDQTKWYSVQPSVNSECVYILSKMKCTWKRFVHVLYIKKSLKNSRPFIWEWLKILLRILLRLKSSWTILCHHKNGQVDFQKKAAFLSFWYTVSGFICFFFSSEAFHVSKQCKCDFRLGATIYLFTPGSNKVKPDFIF